MKFIRPIVLISFLYVLFCLPVITSAQAQSNTSGTKKKYSKGVIYKKDRKRFNGQHLIFDSQSLTFQDQSTAKSVSVPLSEIEYVRARVGTYAVEGGLIGGGLFLLSALAAVAEVEADPTTEWKKDPTEAVIILTAVGFGGGLLIGALFPKEKTVFKRGRFLVNAKIDPNIKTMGPSRTISLVSLNVSF